MTAIVFVVTVITLSTVPRRPPSRILAGKKAFFVWLLLSIAQIRSYPVVSLLLARVASAQVAATDGPDIIVCGLLLVTNYFRQLWTIPYGMSSQLKYNKWKIRFTDYIVIQLRLKYNLHILYLYICEYGDACLLQ